MKCLYIELIFTINQLIYQQRIRHLIFMELYKIHFDLFSFHPNIEGFRKRYHVDHQSVTRLDEQPVRLCKTVWSEG